MEREAERRMFLFVVLTETQLRDEMWLKPDSHMSWHLAPEYDID